MSELLGDVAERMVENNTSIKSVSEINKGGEHSTYVDFKIGQFGMEWSKTSDLGGWRPIAIEAKDDGDTYRVWFQS